MGHSFAKYSYLLIHYYITGILPPLIAQWLFLTWRLRVFSILNNQIYTSILLNWFALSPVNALFYQSLLSNPSLAHISGICCSVTLFLIPESILVFYFCVTDMTNLDSSRTHCSPHGSMCWKGVKAHGVDHLFGFPQGSNKMLATLRVHLHPRVFFQPYSDCWQKLVSGSHMFEALHP